MLLSGFVAVAMLLAQAETIQDEAKVPPYTLPDLLTFADGKPIKDAQTWTKKRRPELLRLFAEHVFGQTPGGRPKGMTWQLRESADDALGGKAIRKQVRVLFTGKADGPHMDLLLYLPKGARGRAPAFLGLNFCGNACVNPDPAIFLTDAWMRNNPEGGVVNNRATEKTRGLQADRWQAETVVARGYALVTAYYGDLDPDFDDGFANGVHPLFYRPGQTRPQPNQWGAVGAWAWGLSRALDYLETEKAVDARRVAVMGHSRLGKAALWAGVQDTRFAMVISNNSGAGGAALSKRIFGERVADMSKRFPHWFAANHRRYDDNEAALPVDHHMLLAMVAPRPLYVASAAQDLWADPRGEFLAAHHASPAWKLLGRTGLPVTEMPPVDKPTHTVGEGWVGYHIRTGKHDVTAYDWEQYLAFADRYLAAVPRTVPRGEQVIK